MKKFILFVLCFAVTFKVMSVPMSDLVPYTPDGWAAPLICSLEEGATTPDYTLKAGVTNYVRFAVKNIGNKKASLGDYVIMVDGEVVVNDYAPIYLDPGKTHIFPSKTFKVNSPGTHTVTGMIDYNENEDEINEDNNTFSANYQWVENKPDLVPYRPNGWSAPLICSLEEGAITPDYTLKTGVYTYVSFAVGNVGNKMCSASDYVILVDGDTVVDDYIPINLSPDDYRADFSKKFIVNSPGIHTVTYKVDKGDHIDELDEDNNTFSADYSWDEPESQPDLVPFAPDGWSSPLVCSMEEGDTTAPSSAILKTGDPIYVNFAVKNIGDGMSEHLDLAIFVDGVKVVHIDDAFIPLAPGSFKVFDDDFIISTPGVHTVTYEVDYGNYEDDELDEANNTFSVDRLWRDLPEEGVNLSYDGGIVSISFTPNSFDDPDGDVGDPLGCVFIDNRFLARFSPEQIEEGHFSYIDNPELNKYIKEILHDLGTCSLYVFIEGDIDGEKYTYSEAAKFNIEGDNYQRDRSAQVWQALESYTYDRFIYLREARENIKTNNWNLTADLTFALMGSPNADNLKSYRGIEDICESCSSLELPEFEGEAVVGSYSGVDLPASFDWRNKGGENWMTSVKNQVYVFRDETAGGFFGRYCGSCYMMGVLGAIEAFSNIDMGDPDFDLDLSEQHGICKIYGESGKACNGGHPNRVFKNIIKYGIVTEECCPYVARDNPNDAYCELCSDCDSKLIKLSGYESWTRGARDLEEWKNTIKENLMETPLTFSVYYDSYDPIKPYYETYSGGIFSLWRNFKDYTDGAHCMVLVGWGDTTINDVQVGYWIVKNSVGPDWGDNGYVKMKMANVPDSTIYGFYKPKIAGPEAGVVSVNTTGTWDSLCLDLGEFKKFVNPIVIMGPPSYNDNSPTTVRVKDITRDGFKFQLNGWDYLEEAHGAEIIPYLVVEKGAHSLDNFKWQAGKIENLNVNFETVELKEGFFSEEPIILTQVVTQNGEEAVVTRLKNVSTSSFEIMLQEEEGNDGIHVGETVHYIALSPGSGHIYDRHGKVRDKDFIVSKTPNSVNHNWYTISFGQSLNSPVVLANMNTMDGTDPAALRYQNPGNSSVEIKVEEEQSRDEEVGHNAEGVGYIVISEVGGGTETLDPPSDLGLFGGGERVWPTEVYLKWEDNSDNEAGFAIERKENAGSFSQIKTFDTNDEKYLDTGLEPMKTYTYRVRAYNYAGYSNYSEEFSVKTTNPYDFGTISVNQPDSLKWHQVLLPPVQSLDKYHNPIVVMGPPSCNDNLPTTIRVRGVRSSYFWFQFDEWDYLDGIHGTENISYMVMEEGVWDVGGSIWEAGSISGVNDCWKTVNFEYENFDDSPVILAQRVTDNDASAAVTRVKDITENSFKIRLQEQEYSDGFVYPPEDIHYIAMQPNYGELDGRKFLVLRKTNCLPDEWYNEVWTDYIGTIESPILIAGMQSFNESDPCALRYNNISESSVYLRVEEEQSGDTEIEHITEDFGYLVISGGPEAPSDLTATAVSGTQVDLTWVDNSGIEDGFKIERKEGEGSFSDLVTVDSDVTSWSDEGVEPGVIYTYRIRAYNSTGNSAYSNEATVTEAKEYEFGEISVNQTSSFQWHTVNFSHTYTDPIVVMGPPSYEDTDPTTIRVKDVTSSGFKFQLDEWDYLDGSHPTETISYIVMEEGAQDIGGGVWEAGKMNNIDHQSYLKNFTHSLAERPVLLTQVVTYNDSSAVCTRIRGLTRRRFVVRLQEEEGNDGEHPGETVHYIAVSPGTGQIDGKDFIAVKTSNSVTHDWHTINFGQSIDSPLVLANMNTEDGDDPSVLRYRNLSSSSVQIKVEEEQSEDEEVRHRNPDEAVGYLVISTVGTETSTFKTTEAEKIYENYIKLASPIITGNIVLNVSSNYDRKASIDLIDIVGRVVDRKNLTLKRGREDLNFGRFKVGVYFLRIKSDLDSKHEVHKITVLR